MKRWQWIVGSLAALLLVLGSYLYTQLRSVDVERLSQDLYVLRGLGGNTAILRTDAGAVVVDTMTVPLQGARIRGLARELTGMDAVLLINTHYHLDHTHGNPAFAEGIIVMSTARTLSHMTVLDGDFWTGDRAAFLPNDVFDGSQTLKLGGKTLELLHPGPGHTDGDLVVLFVEEGAVHLGDLMFNRLYPRIDLGAGGTVRGWPASLDRVMEMTFDRVIPGHGATTDREGLLQFRSFMSQLADLAAASAARGESLDAFLATGELTTDAGYETIRMVVPVGLNRESVLTEAWQEATGNFALAN
ncbi:MAG: MBL fold metallo-hydrolase [Pseudomonadales bacterium]|nr:MBL fold metallo-hydrolase [Pseudomonadales bacterium]NIX08182.1 MBL fold metallo-hydrolase [Pseudomonadales bacterium]